MINGSYSLGSNKINLENDIVSLIQTQEKHFEELYIVGNNPVIWEQHLDKDRWKLNNFRKYIDGGIGNKEGCFTIIDKEVNKIIGTTRYYTFNDEDEKRLTYDSRLISPTYNPVSNQIAAITTYDGTSNVMISTEIDFSKKEICRMQVLKVSRVQVGKNQKFCTMQIGKKS